MAAVLRRAAVGDARDEEPAAPEAGELHLWVVEGNARARRFYEREGWAPDGAAKEDEFGGQVVREVRYRRRLSGAAARE